MQSQGGAGFVGRGAELAMLHERLEQTVVGQGGVVLLAGEPGIGKTRLAEEAAAAARLRDVQVLWGRCYEGEGAPAFWPWLQVLRAAVRGSEDARSRAMLGADAPYLAALLPELRDGATDDVQPLSETAEERFRLFAAVETLLTRIAAGSPLLLILDDLHWADAPSLLLLEFLAPAAGSSPLLIIGTYRDADVGHTHPLRRTLGRLVRLPANASIALKGLATDDVGAVMAAIAGGPLSPSLVATVHEVTEGNPFFVGEMVRYLGPDRIPAPAWAAGGVALPIPPSVREVIDLRLARLGEECRRLLGLAAVLGREFSPRVLAQAREVPVTDLLTLLEDPEDAGLITDSGSMESYRFTHALVRETLYDAISPARRVRLHHQVGMALERLWGDDPEHLAELAWHFTLAAPAGDADRGVSYARRAGDRALALLAYEEASRQYAAALGVLDLRAPADPLLRCELLLSLGEARMRSGETASAADTFELAAMAANRLGTPNGGGPAGEVDRETIARLLARAALGFGGPGGIHGGSRDVLERWQKLLRAALDAMSEEDTPVRARLMARLAETLLSSGSLDPMAVANPRAAVARRQQQRRDASALSYDAVEMARRTGDAPSLAATLSARRWLLAYSLEFAAQRDVTDEIARLAVTLADRELAVTAARWHAIDALHGGDIYRLDAALTSYRFLADSVRQPYHQWYAMLLSATRAVLTGELEAGEGLIQQASAIGRPAAEMATEHFDQQMFLLRVLQGRLEEGEEYARHMIAQFPTQSSRRALLAFALSEAGRDAEARTELDALAADDFALLQHHVTTPELILALLARVCVAVRDTDRASVLYDLLQPYDGRAAASNSGASWLGPVSQSLGMLAGLLSRWDEAESHFSSALAMTEGMTALPWLAQTRYDWAVMLLARNRSGDRDRARELLEQALTASNGLGMARLTERARHAVDLLERADPLPAQAAAVASPAGSHEHNPDHLTAREVEVLRLLAAGRSNQQIADALVVSVATVRGHTIAIYGKIGGGGRAAAAAYALRHNILPPETA